MGYTVFQQLKKRRGSNFKMDLLESWISTIALVHEKGRPNGKLLNWNPDRYFDDLKVKCVGCKIENITDFNYSYCNTYQVVPETTSDKYNYVLVLKISYVVNACCIYWVRYSKDFRRGEVISCGIDVCINPEEILINFMRTEGFHEIESAWMNIPVIGVKLELAEVATLEKCLFDDYED